MRTKSSWPLTATVQFAALLAIACAAQAAPTATQKCQSGKNTAAGKYSDCRQKAEAKYALSLDAMKRGGDLARCATRLQSTFAALAAWRAAPC